MDTNAREHDEEVDDVGREKQDAAARAAGSVKDDITPDPHPVRDAVEDLIPGDSDGDGH